MLCCLAGCGYLAKPVAFRAEYARLKSEAQRNFPMGSSAAAFETWFEGKSAFKLINSIPSVLPSKTGAQCEPRTMWLQRVEGCMNVMTANYCVDGDGKITTLKFSEGGYC